MRVNERRVCEGVMPLRPVVGFLRPRSRSRRSGVLETALQIQTDLLDQIGVLTEECVDTLQDGVEMDAQPAQFQVGEAELGVKSAAHKWLGISSGSPAEATCG